MKTKKKSPRTSKKLQFPHPSEVTDENPVAVRSSDDLIAMANAANGSKYTSFSVKVREWVADEAAKAGWRNVFFPLAYPSRTLRAGAVFIKA